MALVFLLGTACRPGAGDAGKTIAARLEKVARTGSPVEFEDLPLTPASVELLRGLVLNHVDVHGLLAGTAEVLSQGKPGALSTFGYPGSPNRTVQLVPNGHDWLVDLPLSNVTFAELRDKEYPEPW